MDLNPTAINPVTGEPLDGSRRTTVQLARQPQHTTIMVSSVVRREIERARESDLYADELDCRAINSPWD